MREKLAGFILVLIFSCNAFGEDVAQPWGLSPLLTIPEGAVGILYLGGFYKKTYKPGVHIIWGWPFIQGILVNVRPQIDIIENIPCGTKDGLTITFPRVAVYNQLREKDVMNIVSNFGENYDHYLITEPTIQAITELCTTMTAQEVYIDNFPTINDYLYHHLIEEQEKSESNLRINKVVVSKPELPENIRRNYEVLDFRVL